MSICISIGVAIAMNGPFVGQPQREYANAISASPSMSTLFSKAAELKRAGLHVYYPSSMHDRADNRWKIAVFGYQCFEYMRDLTVRLEKEDSAGSTSRNEVRDSLEFLAKHYETAEYLLRATWPELKVLKVDAVALDQDLTRMATIYGRHGFPVRRFDDIRFTDIPKSHWASEATDELRKVGVLWGYPKNSFQPDKPWPKRVDAARLRSVFGPSLSKLLAHVNAKAYLRAELVWLASGPITAYWRAEFKTILENTPKSSRPPTKFDLERLPSMYIARLLLSESNSQTSYVLVSTREKGLTSELQGSYMLATAVSIWPSKESESHSQSAEIASVGNLVYVAVTEDTN